LAARGRKVLLIDADMRNPSIHKFFGVRNLIGFSDLLSGNDDLSKLTLAGPIPTLTIITSGPIPPNPSELLSGTRLSEVLERLLMVYDHVVFDAPPVMGLADSPIIAAQVEGTVFVIAAVETRAKAARIALRRLADVQAHIIGAILTKFNVKQVGYEYGYSYDYGERNTPRRNGQVG
jgi:polysaccharide biosynthesis transport protein